MAYDFDELLGDGPAPDAVLRQSFHVASQTDPNAAAEAQRLAASQRVPVDVAQRNAPELKRQAKFDEYDFDALLSDAPKAAAWLGDPNNASVAVDDLPAIMDTEKAIRKHGAGNVLGKALMKGFSDVGLGTVRIPGYVGTLGDALNKGYDQRPEELKRATRELMFNNPLTDPFKAASEYWTTPELNPQLIKNIKAGKLGAAGEDLLYHVATNTPQMLTSMIAGFGGAAVRAASLAQMGGSTAATATGESLEQGFGPETAVVRGTLHGAAEVGFEYASFGLLKPWEEAIANAVGKDAAKRVLGDMAKAFVANSVGEGSEEVNTTIAQALTDYWLGVDKDALKNLDEKAMESFLVGAAMGGGMQAPAVVGAGMARGAEIRKAEAAKKTYLEVGQLATNSELRKRLPEKYQQLMQNQFDGTDLENVHVPVQAFEEYAAKSGLDPMASMLELGFQEEYAHAKSTGGDIVVPHAAWLTKLADTPHYAALADDIRYSADTLTPKELAEELSAADQAAQAGAPAEMPQTMDGPAQVGEIVKEMLLKTGEEPGRAAAQAKIWEQRYRARAERRGLDATTATDLLKQWPLRIQREGVDLSFDTEAFDAQAQEEKAQTEAAYNLEAEKELAKAGGLTPLADAVRELGGLDVENMKAAGERAELQDMNHFFKPGGLSPDRMVMALQELGTLMQAQGITTPGELFEALRQERIAVENYKHEKGKGDSKAGEAALARLQRLKKKLAQSPLNDVAKSATSGNMELSSIPTADEIEALKAEIERLKQELGEERYLRRTSPLTGLPNKLAFEEDQAADPTDHVVAFDLSNFKAYNTLLGHTAVDEQVFPELGLVLRKAAGELGLNIYHRSGDEFIATNPAGSEAESRVKMAQLVMRMKDIGLDVRGMTKDNEKVRYIVTGIPPVYGIGESYESADAKALGESARRRSLPVDDPDHLEDLRQAHGVPNNFHRIGLDGKIPAGLARAIERHRQDVQSFAGNPAGLKPAQAIRGAIRLNQAGRRAPVWNGYTYEDLQERYDNQVDEVLRQFRDSKGKKSKLVRWPVVKADELSIVWKSFAKYGEVRDAGALDKIANSVLDGIARLKFSNEVSGHEQIDPAEALESADYELTEKQIEQLQDFLTDEKGNWFVSDYGLPKLMDLYPEILHADTPEEKLVAIDRALNIVHQRSDLAALFVEGGASTLTKLSLADASPSRTLDQPAAPQPRLSALHNLTAEKLQFADEMGGLAVPSIAVVPQSVEAPSEFGEITLIGGKGLGDPRKSPIFDSDVYSPRFPKAEYKKAKSKDASSVVDGLKPFAKEFEDSLSLYEVWDEMVNRANPEEAIYRLTRSSAAKAAFLRQQGVKAEPVVKDYVPYANTLSIDPRFLEALKALLEKNPDPSLEEAGQALKPIVKTMIEERADALEVDKAEKKTYVKDQLKKYFDGNEMMVGYLDQEIREAKKAGTSIIDKMATEDKLDELLKGREAEFKKWAEDLVLPHHGEPFLTIGRRKVPFNLDNVVKAMKGSIQGEESTLTHSTGKTRAMAAERFKNLEEMRAAAAENIISEEKLQAARAKADKLLSDFRESAAEAADGEMSAWDSFDGAMRAISTWLNTKRTRDSFVQAMQGEGFPVDAESPLIDQGIEAAEALIRTPVPYFEAKPQRAVALSEFPGAVVPDDTDQATLDILAKNGIQVATYDSSDPKSRQQALVDLRQRLADQGKDTLFQPAYHGTPHKFSKFTLDHIGSGEGAQAYGWGLYFAGNKEVARWYRDQLTRTQTIPPAAVKELRDLDILGYDTYAEALKDVREAIKDGKNWKELWDVTEPTPALDEYLATGLNKGALYTVDIPEDSELLDYDKPMSQQPKKVKDALDLALLPLKLRSQISNGRIKGGEFYEKLVSFISKHAEEKRVQKDYNFKPGQPPDEVVSRYLLFHGIPGLRYLDAGSRRWQVTLSTKKGEYATTDFATKQQAEDYAKEKQAEGFETKVYQDGSHNYVIWDEASIQMLTELQQDPRRGKDARGEIRITPEETLITLGRTADASTFLHESWHRWFFEMAEDAEYVSGLPERNAVQQRLLDDFNSLLKEVGAKDWASMTEQQQEQLAKWGEAYLMEGKAPTAELRGAMARFRAWLVSVYRNMQALLQGQQPLTPEIQGILDRMLATDEQIAAAQAELEAAPLPGLENDPAYARALDEAREAAERELSTKVMAEWARERAAWWKDEREKLVKESIARHGKERVYKALAFLQHGTLPDGSPLPEGTPTFKLDKESIVGLFGSLRLPRARPYVYQAEGGMDVETAAELMGFSSADEMLTALDEAVPLKKLAAEEADAEMKALHGDMMLDGTMADEARKAVHNDKRAQLLRMEFKHLASQDLPKLKGLVRKVANRMPSEAALRAQVQTIIGRRAVKDIKPINYQRAESKARREAVDLLLKGDVQGAMAAKQKEMLNHELYRAAVVAREEVDALAEHMRKLQKPSVRERIGKAGGEYLDQLDALAERYSFAPVSIKSLERRASLREFLAKMDEQNTPVDVPEAVLNEARQVSYKEVPYEELVGLRDTVLQIEHLAKLKNKLLKAGRMRELDAAIDESTSSIEANSKGPRPKEVETRLPQDELLRAGAGFLASHRKMSSLLRQMDGFKDGGIMWELLMRPLNEAGNAEAVANEKATKELKAIFDAYGVADIAKMYRKEYIPGANTSLTKMGQLMVALNWGNEDNRQKLMDGYGWEQAQVQAVLDRLDERDWKTVQAIWDYIDSYWPETEAMSKRVKGVAPEKVQPAPVSTRFGTFKGGYFPLKYDDRQEPKAFAHLAEEAAKRAMGAGTVRSSTKQGHRKARVEGVKMPVRLDFGVIFEHVAEVIHDQTHYETLIDMNKLLGDRRLQSAIITHHGDQVYRQLTGAVNDIAAGNVPAQQSMERAINYLRVGTTISGLGWNLLTSMMQPLGLTQSMVRIGPKWVAKGLGRVLGDAKRMENTAAWIYEKSDFMRLRGKTQQREINEVRNELRLRGKLSSVEDSFFWLIAKGQQLVDIPTWAGAYEKAMADAETDPDVGAMTPEDQEKWAVEQADQAVLDSQGGGQVKDLAQIQRGGPLLKLWTNFYSFFNTTYNLAVESVGRTKWKSPASVGRLGVDMLLLYVAPAMMAMALREAVKGSDDDDDLLEKYIREQVAYIMGSMVLVREVSSAVQGFRGYEGPAGTRAFAEAGRLVKQVEQGDVDEAMLRSLNNVAGILFHYPAGQVDRTVRGTLAASEGQAGPQAALFGPPRK